MNATMNSPLESPHYRASQFGASTQMIREDHTAGNVTPVLMAIHSGDTSEVPSGSPYMRQGGQSRVISINSGAPNY